MMAGLCVRAIDDTIERFVTRKFIAEGDYRDWDRIDAWADGIARDLNRLQPS